MLEIIAMHVVVIKAFLVKIRLFDARRVGWALGHREYFFGVAKGPRGSYICIEYAEKSVLHLVLRKWSYAF